MHDYVGMTFDLSIPSKVKMSMDDYIDKVLKGFPRECFKTAPTPVSEHLFKVCDENERKVLPEEQGSIYHHVVAQLLSVAFQVRHDILSDVAFLTTRMKALDKDDWGKLKQVTKHLKGTKQAKITLRADSLSIIKWWMDVAFVSHHNCRGQSGGMISLGAGAVIIKSQKQRTNGKKVNIQ